MLRFTRRAALQSVFAAASIALLASCSDRDSTGPNATPLFKTMYVFGASLDDTGNACNASAATCPPAPYATGRYSNGPLYVELIANKYGATVTPSRTGGTNYAYAGARTGPIAGTNQAVPNMVQQVATFLATPNNGERDRALFVLDGATVGNDITDALVIGVVNPTAAAAVISASVSNIVAMVNQLYAGGARHILLFNSTDIGRTPQVRALGAVAIAGATALSTQFNTALAAQLPALRSNSGLNIYLVDLGALTTEVFTTPATFGFTNLTQPCVVLAPASVCAAPDTYFFWDSFHPTAATGRLVSARAITAIGR